MKGEGAGGVHERETNRWQKAEKAFAEFFNEALERLCEDG
jgi:hypothetical protein